MAGGKNNLGETGSSRISNLGIPANLQLGEYLGIARRRKWYIILTTLGMFIATAVFVSRLPDIYRAETVILVDSAQVPDKYVPTINTGDIAGRLTTLQQQVLSPTRLRKLVESQSLFPDPDKKKTEEQVIGSVQKAITVEVVNQGAGKMSAFRIAYSGRRRNEVARVANQLAQMFIEENLNSRIDQTKDTAQFLEDELQETKKQLDDKDAQLRTIKTRNLDELPESKPYHLETLANLRTQLQTIQNKIQQDQQEKNVLQSMLLSGAEAPTVEVGDGIDGGGATLNPNQTEIQKLQTRLSELKLRYGPGHPDVRKVQAEINRLTEKGAAEAQNNNATPAVQPQVTVQQNQKHRNPVLEAQIEGLDQEIKTQSKLLPAIESQMNFHESKLQQMPVFEQEISRLQQDTDILKAQYTRLLDQEKAAEISHALEVRQKGEKFEVLDAATTPSGPSSPNRRLISIAGLFGGLLAGIALAAAAEMNDESVRTEDEAAQIFGKAVMTGIPRIVSMKERRDSRVKAAGLIAGTVFGSIAIGFLLALVSGRFL
jgi:polysaccharide biosynthesis transport protein